MSSFLDTSVIVRYLTGDPPQLLDQAARIIDDIDDLQMTDVVLAETAYVLTSIYRMPRDVVVDHLVALVQKENISVFAMDKGLTIQGLLMCRASGRVSFADAMLWAVAHSSNNRVVYSLDQRFPDDGVEIRRE